MELTVNGETLEVAEVESVQALLQRLGYAAQYVAVAVNEEAVPRNAYATTPVRAKDRIEILSPMQGG